MPSLLDFLKDRRADEPLIGTEAGWMSAGELQRRAQLLRSEAFAPLCGQTVTLRFTDPIKFVEGLIGLDGWASGILLCDARIDAGLLNRFEADAQAAWRLEAGTARPIRDVAAVQGAGKESTRWIIPTSGTTGEPKLVSHTLTSLCRTVKSRSSAAESLTWGLWYEPTRFAGLQVLLQALGGGGNVVVPSQTHLIADVELLARLGCSALSATPSFWRKLAFGGLLERLSLRTVTLGGEAADQLILDLLASRFPKATIRHIYASTEAGVGFSVSDRRAGFPAAFLDQPPAGMELRVRQSDGMLLLKPARVEQEFIGRAEHLIGGDGWIETGDLVEQRGDRFHFLGRANGCINVGGRKVHPLSVEEVILGVPGVQAARVFGRRNPILGALVAAEIVVERGRDTNTLQEQILRACKASLARFQVPAVVSFVEQLQLSPGGKLPR
jgi:acyl-CoA synthetase (AMP-forming)/AMP-acid ligase II